LAIQRFQKSGGFLAKDCQAPPHRIDDALGNASATTRRGDAADHGYLSDSFGGNRRWDDARRLLGFKKGEGGNGSNTRHLWGNSSAAQNKVHLSACEDHLEHFWCPFGGQEDDGTAGQPDGMSSGNVVDFKAKNKVRNCVGGRKEGLYPM